MWPLTPEIDRSGGSPPRAPPRKRAPSDVTDAASASITEFLHAWGAGDRAALDALIPIVYHALHQQARLALRREGVGHTLQPTALVNEAFLRLVEQRHVRWESRTQFFAVAAQLMRRVLVDHARARRSAKRGGRVHHVTLAAARPTAGHGEADAVDVLALDEALERLTALDPAKVRIVELRYFAGLSVDETAKAVGVSPSTIDREWAVAKRWLRRELER